MPFLVDSVRMVLNGRGYTNHLVVHPRDALPPVRGRPHREAAPRRRRGRRRGNHRRGGHSHRGRSPDRAGGARRGGRGGAYRARGRPGRGRGLERDARSASPEHRGSAGVAAARPSRGDRGDLRLPRMDREQPLHAPRVRRVPRRGHRKPRAVRGRAGARGSGCCATKGRGAREAFSNIPTAAPAARPAGTGAAGALPARTFVPPCTVRAISTTSASGSSVPRARSGPCAGSSVSTPPPPTTACRATSPLLRRKAADVLGRAGYPPQQPRGQGAAEHRGHLSPGAALPGPPPTSCSRRRWGSCTCRSGSGSGCSCIRTASGGSTRASCSCR